MARSKLRAPSRGEAVVTALRDKILRGEFEPGFHLQEIPLAEMLGVSRTPIREALGILAQEGLLEVGPKRGYKVRTFTLKEVVDAYDIRANLEGLAARVLAERGLDANVAQQIEACLKTGDSMLRNGLDERDQAAWLEMNNTFHTAIATATRNEMLLSFVVQSHRVPLASSRHVHWYQFDQKTFAIAKRAHEAHHEIYLAIRDRQAVSAESLMREHIYFSKRLIIEHVGDQTLGFSGTPLEFESSETE